MQNKKKRVHLISMGCDKNLADSEKTLGILVENGYEYCDDPSLSDVVIVNTCCFIRDAKTESVETLIEMADLKSERQKQGAKAPLLVVMGCMAERYKEEITETLPEVDVLIGTNSWQDIDEAICRALETGDKVASFRPISDNVFSEKPVKGRLITAGGHCSYLKIAEGCAKSCSYCIIPSLKGKYRSVPMEDLIEEAENLAESGVRELILVAQETTLYGTDLYGRKMLPELLRRLNAIEGIRWIRLMYCYPEEITDELIEAIRSLPKVLHYIDMPVQHASDHILRRMARATAHDEIIERIRRMREQIPDIVIRTSLISGFPGETDADHKILTEFVREVEFDRLGVFEYSREEGTRAAKFGHQVSAALKKKRRDEIMSIQHDIAGRKAAERIGQEFDVIIEGRMLDADAADIDAGAEGGNVYVGRTYMDAPEVDGLIYVNTGRKEYMTGDIIRVRVTGAGEYDLTGELI